MRHGRPKFPEVCKALKKGKRFALGLVLEAVGDVAVTWERLFKYVGLRVAMAPASLGRSQAFGSSSPSSMHSSTPL